jgi:hypothetical protein
VLQDLVNELGRRLEYAVTNGDYRGKVNAIGFDGIWKAEAWSLVVEVKTTDAYRINLDTIAAYRQRLIDGCQLSEKSSILLVVGRQDTGDLEAQVRGSRHAWQVRIISLDALMKLVALKEEAEEDTVAKSQELLIPFEYTRLDRIIDIAFTVAKEAKSVLEDADQIEGNPEETASTVRQRHTPKEIIGELRDRMVAAIQQREKSSLVRKSAALYWSPDKRTRMIGSVSKSYGQGTYWYAYHTLWDKFLAEGKNSYYVLGGVGSSQCYALPHSWIHSRLPRLNTTTTPDGRVYWHIKLDCYGAEPRLRLERTGERDSVEEFRIRLP